MHDNLTMPVLPKDTCSKYFKQIDISAGTWKCKCGKVLVQKKNTGWSNLLNHVKRQHPEEWWNTYAMVERYGKFREILSQPEFSREKLIIDFIPTPRENADIAELEKKIGKV